MKTMVNLVESSEELPLSSLENILADLGTGKNFLRLPRHVRSQCRAQENGAYLYVKGGEILGESYVEYLKDLDRRKYRQSGRSFLHHFSNYEDKVPAVLKFSEAQNDYLMALHLQKRHFSHSGRWLNSPRPIFLLQAQDQLRQKTVDALQSVLGPAEFTLCEKRIAEEGIGIFVYVQNSAPHRLDDYLDKKSWFYLKDTFPAELDLGQAYKEWVYTFLFLLSQRILPIHEGSIGLGSPLDKGNLCLSGGIADLGTCYIATNETSQDYIERSFEMSLHSLVDLGQSIACLEREESLKKLDATVLEHFGSSHYLRSGLTSAFVAYYKKFL